MLTLLPKDEGAFPRPNSPLLLTTNWGARRSGTKSITLVS
jgi:hypothetical protein